MSAAQMKRLERISAQLEAKPPLSFEVWRERGEAGEAHHTLEALIPQLAAREQDAARLLLKLSEDPV